MEDSAGKPTGYAVEFCSAIAAELGPVTGGVQQIKYIPVAVDQRVRLLREGSIDMLCDSFTIAEDRRAQVEYSAPIFYDQVQVMVRTKDKISTLDQLNGESVSVINTTTAGRAVDSYNASNGSKWKISRAVGADAAFGQLQLGWVKGYARDGVLLANQKRAMPNASDFEILPTPLSSEPIGIGLRRGDQAMKTLSDSVVVTAMKNGAMDSWYTKYFLSATPSAQPLNIPMSARLREQIQAAK